MIDRLRRRLARRVRLFCSSRYVQDASDRFNRGELNEVLEHEIDALGAGAPGRGVVSVEAGVLLARRVKALRGSSVVQVDSGCALRPDVVAGVCDLRCFEDASFDAG